MACRDHGQTGGHCLYEITPEAFEQRWEDVHVAAAHNASQFRSGHMSQTSYTNALLICRYGIRSVRVAGQYEFDAGYGLARQGFEQIADTFRLRIRARPD